MSVQLLGDSHIPGSLGIYLCNILIMGYIIVIYQSMNPDYAVAEFAEDARRRVRRRTLVLQVPYNKANSVKSATPCGFKCRKNISKISFTFWVKDLNTFVKYNRPILKIKFPFSVFEVHNSG